MFNLELNFLIDYQWEEINLHIYMYLRIYKIGPTWCSIYTGNTNSILGG